MRHLIVFAGLGMVLAGCAKAGFVTAARTTTSTPTVPWQVAPDTEWTVRAHRDVPRFSVVKGWGLVLATPRVLASLAHELRPVPGHNRTVEPCKRQIELGAAQYSHAMVEAASLGPERRTNREVYEGLVEMRVVYDFHLYFEVRQATLKCYTRPDGSIVAAEAAFPGSPTDGSDV